MLRRNILPLIGLLVSSALLIGCVAEEATPVLVDPTGFVTYVSPTGVFTLSMPPDWIVSDKSDEFALNVEFSPPGSPEPLVGVYVASASALSLDPASGQTPSYDEMLLAYQSRFYASADATYKEIARDQQADGSLRIKFLLEGPVGTTQHNDFVQVIGPYFVALRTTLPADQAQLRTLSRVVNTLTVNQNAGWASSVESESAASRDVVGFTALNAWVDRNGGFEIVGQVVNNAPIALEFVRINAQLYDAENRLLLEQDDFVSSDMIAPGGYAPFSIVFSDGMPPGTVRYELHASARYADFTTQTFYGPENFAVSSTVEFDRNGLLVVSGQVRNEGTLRANLVKVIVTIFDENGRVIATDTTLVEVQRLAPGEVSPFSVTFFELGGSPGTFQVIAQGMIDE